MIAAEIRIQRWHDFQSTVQCPAEILGRVTVYFVSFLKDYHQIGPVFIKK